MFRRTRYFVLGATAAIGLIAYRFTSISEAEWNEFVTRVERLRNS